MSESPDVPPRREQYATRKALRRARKDARRDYRIMRQWFFWGSGILIPIILGVLALNQFKFDAQLADLAKFEKKIENEVQGRTNGAVIEILDQHRRTLNGATVEGKWLRNVPQPKDWSATHIVERYPSYLIEFGIIVKNDSNYLAKNLTLKFYAKAPIVLANKNSSDTDFDTEITITPQQQSVTTLPGHMSETMTIVLQDFSSIPPGAKPYPLAMEAYYGDGKVAPALFEVHLTEAR